MMKMIRKMMTTYITHKLNIRGICNRKFNIRNRKFKSVHSCALYFEVKLFQHFIGPICLLNLCGRVTLLIHFTGLKFTTWRFCFMIYLVFEFGFLGLSGKKNSLQMLAILAYFFLIDWSNEVSFPHKISDVTFFSLKTFFRLLERRWRQIEKVEKMTQQKRKNAFAAKLFVL